MTLVWSPILHLLAVHFRQALTYPLWACFPAEKWGEEKNHSVPTMITACSHWSDSSVL